MLGEKLPSSQIIPIIAETYQSHISERTRFIYLLVLALLTTTGASLPFIRVSVNVKSSALIRPVTEVTLIRAPASGRIVEAAIRENQAVHKDEVLFVVESEVMNEREAALMARMEDAERMLHDLKYLTTSSETLLADSGYFINHPVLRVDLYNNQPVK